RRLKKDLALSSLPREKVLATIVQLLERSLIRVGNEEYARENKSFGLTTMQDRHVDVKGSKLRFRFRGKSGRQHEVDVTDRRIARIVMKLQDLAGQSLFQYLDDEGNARDITSQDVNEYLREITGADFTAKDFRTWAGTVLAAVALGKLGASETKRQAKTNIKHAIGAVAEVLGNTPAIRRSVTSTSCWRPLLPRKRNRSFEPFTSTCRSCMVVRPNDLFSRAYSSLPTRMRLRSRSCTIVASTFSRGRLLRAKSFLSRLRIFG